MSYLTFKANDASVASTVTPDWVNIGSGGMQYRAVGATEWVDVAKKTSLVVDIVGIEIKADNMVCDDGASKNSSWTMTGSISASGDVTSVTNGVGGDCPLVHDCYENMFNGCTALTTAPALPSTTVAEDCYYQMFFDCTSLTAAPELPATTLAPECYRSMFQNCTSLTVAPTLPATNLAWGCYEGMFQNCTSLTVAPALPAMVMAADCYHYMFTLCTSLVAAPELPATTLADHCYQAMFQGCTALTVPSALPATTLAFECYAHMYFECTALTGPPELPATNLAQNCYWWMFKGCTSMVGYITAESGCTLIHNHPTTSVANWNASMYESLNAASTVPATPVSNTNYYFRPATPPTPTPSIVGKRLECVGAGYYIG